MPNFLPGPGGFIAMLTVQFHNQPIRFEVAKFSAKRPAQFERLKTCLLLGLKRAEEPTAQALRMIVSGLADLCLMNPHILITPDLADLGNPPQNLAESGYASVSGLGTSTPPKHRKDPRIWLAEVGGQAPPPYKEMPLPAVLNFFWHEALHLVADFSHTDVPKDMNDPNNKRWRDTMHAVAKAFSSTLYDPVLKHEVGLYAPDAWH